MRILVIDDEMTSRRILCSIMKPFGEVDGVETGTAAVSVFQKALEEEKPYGLVMLDIVMPDMDGRDVLSALRNIEQETGVNLKPSMILMTSAHSDKDTVIASLQAGSNGFIVKPYNRKAIHEKLRNLGMVMLDSESGSDEKTRPITVRESLARVIDKFKKGEIELPVFPEVVQEVERVINQPKLTIDELSHVIEKDAVISAKLIVTANSPMHRGIQDVHSVRQSINRLGFRETQRIVVTLANDGFYNTGNKLFKGLMEKLRLYSLASAHGASLLAGKLGFENTEKFFLMGLIHDMGSVLLLWTLGEIMLQDEAADANEVLESIQDIHNSFGAVLLERWKFPPEFIEVAKLHEGPRFHSKIAKEILVVNLASNLAFNIGYGFYERKESALTDLDSTKLLQVDSAVLEATGKEVNELIELSSELK